MAYTDPRFITGLLVYWLNDGDPPNEMLVRVRLSFNC